MIIDRRNFLKFGAAFPLAIQSLGTKASTQNDSKPPRRIIFICNSLGFYEPYFFPKIRGDFSTSKYLKSIVSNEKLTVFQNLFHPGMDTSNHDSEKSFLTGAPYPEGVNFTNTISIDQVLARHIGNKTRFPYLSFSIYDRGWGCSWNERGVAIPPMHDETKIYNRLFGDEDLSAKKRRIAKDKRIVQSLYHDLEQIKKGSKNTTKIESYRTVIAELESQLKHEEFWLKAKKPEVPNSLSEDQEYSFSTKIRNLLELSRLAFQTDSTRIITISLDWIYGAINVPGATGGWHTLSHHAGKAEALEKLSRIEIEIMKQLNQFLVDLDEIEEGSTTLLDNTTVMIGSNFGDASKHTCRNLPTIVAGGGYRHQTHAVLEKPTPLCNLYLDILHSHNVDQGSFGSSDKKLGLLNG